MIILKEEYQYIQEKMAEVLSKFEQEVLGKYLSGKTYREISVELDKEPKSIDNALQRIKKKMDNFIERDDLSVLP